MDEHLIVRTNIPRYKRKKGQEGINDVILMKGDGKLTKLYEFKEDIVFNPNEVPADMSPDAVRQRQSRAEYNKEKVSARAFGQRSICLGFRSGKLITLSREGRVIWTWSAVPSQDSHYRVLDMYRPANSVIGEGELEQICAKLMKTDADLLKKLVRPETERLFTQEAYYEWMHAINSVKYDGYMLYAATPYGLFVFSGESLVPQRIVDGDIGRILKPSEKILYVCRGDSVLARIRGEKKHSSDYIQSIDGSFRAEFPKFDRRTWCGGFEILGNTLYFLCESGHGKDHYCELIARNMQTNEEKRLDHGHNLGNLRREGLQITYGKDHSIMSVSFGKVSTLLADIPLEACGPCSFDSEHSLLYWSYSHQTNQTKIKSIGGETLHTLKGLAHIVGR